VGRGLKALGRADPALLWLAALSGVLYVVLHYAQDTLLNFALTPPGATTSVWDEPANRPQFLVLLGMYIVAVLGLLAAYDRVVWLARRNTWSAWGRRMALGLPVLFYLSFLFGTPYFSSDLFSYAAYGFIGTLPGGNPYYQEGRTIAETAFGLDLISLGWRGSALSPYGPIWNLLMTGVVRFAQEAVQVVFLTKVIVVAATLGSAVAADRILAQIRPAYRLAGTVAVLWNPVLVILLAGEGHNDALVMLLVLTSLALTVQHHPFGGTVVQAAAVLTKYLPILLLPLQVAYWWRTTSDRRHLLRDLVIAAGLAVIAAIALYAPVWLGAATFVGTGALGAGTPPPGGLQAAHLVEFVRYAAVGGAVLAGTWSARSGTRLIDACGWVLLVALLVGPQRFWPWYAALPVALLALSPAQISRWTALVVGACVLLASPIEALPLSGQGPISVELQALVFHATRVVPLLAIVAACAWRLVVRNRWWTIGTAPALLPPAPSVLSQKFAVRIERCWPGFRRLI
jgi:alpha-1,6-mannosyltransferase